MKDIKDSVLSRDFQFLTLGSFWAFLISVTANAFYDLMTDPSLTVLYILIFFGSFSIFFGSLGRYMFENLDAVKDLSNGKVFRKWFTSLKTYQKIAKKISKMASRIS